MADRKTSADVDLDGNASIASTAVQDTTAMPPLTSNGQGRLPKSVKSTDALLGTKETSSSPSAAKIDNLPLSIVTSTSLGISSEQEQTMGKESSSNRRLTEPFRDGSGNDGSGNDGSGNDGSGNQGLRKGKRSNRQTIQQIHTAASSPARPPQDIGKPSLIITLPNCNSPTTTTATTITTARHKRTSSAKSSAVATPKHQAESARKNRRSKDKADGSPLPSAATPAPQDIDDALLWTSAAIVNVDVRCDACLQLECPYEPGQRHLLTCRMCGQRVHPGCYGLNPNTLSLQLACNYQLDFNASADISGDADKHADATILKSQQQPSPRPADKLGDLIWFCDVCAAGCVRPTCCLCPSLGGIMKETTVKGVYCHATCAALFSPDVYLHNDTIAAPVVLTQLLNTKRKKSSSECAICWNPNDRGFGITVLCRSSSCNVRAHPTCALRAGCLWNFGAKMIFQCHDHVQTAYSKAQRLSYQVRVHDLLQSPPGPLSKREEDLLGLARAQREASLAEWLQRHGGLVSTPADLQPLLNPTRKTTAPDAWVAELAPRLSHQLVDDVYSLQQREVMVEAECKLARYEMHRLRQATTAMEGFISTQQAKIEEYVAENKKLNTRFRQLQSIYKALGLPMPPANAPAAKKAKADVPSSTNLGALLSVKLSGFPAHVTVVNGVYAVETSLIVMTQTPVYCKHVQQDGNQLALFLYFNPQDTTWNISTKLFADDVFAYCVNDNPTPYSATQPWHVLDTVGGGFTPYSSARVELL
eukprot:TRINITY_DN12200_c0_g1_i9.p1 TRINITY_DN12200_c0_g1~~TRINITY_DN12200_c0_g1_i9.p1  ORF type:complete len:760 (+),score=162.80 TRINITY_DN12200_c0_g1_i9:47-2326(+)